LAPAQGEPLAVAWPVALDEGVLSPPVVAPPPGVLSFELELSSPQPTSARPAPPAPSAAALPRKRRREERFLQYSVQ
jgi:hypothetical protein